MVVRRRVVIADITSEDREGGSVLGVWLCSRRFCLPVFNFVRRLYVLWRSEGEVTMWGGEYTLNR